ncbi:hypothetical protein KP509_37G008700 [Ceratopteris richardii]|uniref:Uncharacterized protein n=1 Tax=Ceratopteris richardii TaxID=49495 RepID=A0A8T2Q5G9_CERRI|nr:hypothetical protein KP509_37G008700 [Ceratopteris richardii]
MMGSSSVVPPSSVVGVQYDPLLLSCSRKKQQTQRCASRDIILNSLRGPFQIRSHLHQLAHGTEPIGVCSISIRNGGLRCIGGCTCAVCPQNGGWTNRCSQLVTCRDSIRSLRSWNSNALGIGFSCGTRHASVRARVFNPQNGGDDGNSMGRTIFNLAGAGLLTYLTITGKLNWLFDAIFTFWLVSAVIWWFAGRSLIKGPVSFLF